MPPPRAVAAFLVAVVGFAVLTKIGITRNRGGASGENGEACAHVLFALY